MPTSTGQSDPLIRVDRDDQRKNYSTPELRLLGAISDLTDGGSGTAAENSQGGMKRP
jgi:hypothetical protein